MAYYSDPTWGNHGLIFKNAGFKDVRKYRYYDAKRNGLDFEGYLADLEAAPERSVIILGREKSSSSRLLVQAVNQRVSL